MFSVATVEIRNGDRLTVRSKESQAQGDMLSSLFLELSNYCDGDSESQWVVGLEPFFNRRLCDVVQPLLKANYSGDWDYFEDEYRFFMKRVGDIPISEEEFKNTVLEVRSMWTDINVLYDITAQLLTAFQNAKLDPVVPFYEPPHTENELKALLGTLQLLRERGAKEARIAFV